MNARNRRTAGFGPAVPLVLLAALAACADPTPVETRLSEVDLRAIEQGMPDSLRARYREDAARLALREVARRRPLEDEPVELPADLVRSAYHALLLVYGATAIPARDSVVEVFPIHTFPAPVLHEVIVAPEVGVPWAQGWREGHTLTGDARIDALIQEYRLRLGRFYDWSFGPAAVLVSDPPVNIEGLAALFAPLPGVRYAEPNGHGGDGNDIRAERLHGGWRIEYSVGSGDCPAGCIRRHAWTFAVTDAGSVSYRGSSGDPLVGR